MLPHESMLGLERALDLSERDAAADVLEMSELSSPRTPFLVWALVVCPILAWAIAVYGVHGEGGGARLVFLFVVLPALLTIGGGMVMRRRWAETTVVAVLSAIAGGLSWILTVVYLVSQGFFD